MYKGYSDIILQNLIDTSLRILERRVLMKKTKEITGYILSSSYGQFDTGIMPAVYSINEIDVESEYTQVKLIIEIPEKKVEITESDFDKAWDIMLPLSHDKRDDLKSMLRFK